MITEVSCNSAMYENLHKPLYGSVKAWAESDGWKMGEKILAEESIVKEGEKIKLMIDFMIVHQLYKDGYGPFQWRGCDFQ